MTKKNKWMTIKQISRATGLPGSIVERIGFLQSIPSRGTGRRLQLEIGTLKNVDIDITAREAEELLGYSRKSGFVARMVRDGKLRGIRMGRKQWMLRLSDVLEFRDQQKKKQEQDGRHRARLRGMIKA